MYASSSVSAWYVTSQPVTRVSFSATSCSVIALGTGLVVPAPVVAVAEQDRDGSVRYVVACHRPDAPVGPRMTPSAPARAGSMSMLSRRNV